jgi:alpha-L-fucosidase
MMLKKLIKMVLAVLLVFSVSFTGVLGMERTASQEWFEDAKFGMFIHWGLYSILQGSEWVMNEAGIPVREYEKLASKFNPPEFNAGDWVSLAKSAGMSYITVTSKHHEGFCIFDSKLTKYDIVDSTPFKRDVMAELAEECRKQGIKLFFYYSLLDWHHPDYFPLGDTGHYSDRGEGGNWEKYVEYYKGQLREICSNYGKIGGLWFDGWWDKPDADWDLQGAYELIHTLQPDALIINNHHRKPFPGEDIQEFERDLPGENLFGFSGGAAVSQLPLETCGTINDSWGYNKSDHNYKSVKELIHCLVRSACMNCNLLLDIGPMPDGKIDEQFRKRLAGMGQWLKENGNSIYGTRGGPYAPDKWGGATWKGSRIYLHVLKPKSTKLVLPEISSDILSVSLLDGTELETVREKGKISVNIPKKIRDEIDTIIVIETKGEGPFYVKGK